MELKGCPLMSQASKPFTLATCKALCHINYTNEVWHATKIICDYFIPGEAPRVNLRDHVQ